MGKAGQGVGKAGKFNLKYSLFCLSPLSKNTDNYFLAVKTGNARKLFPVSLLAWFKIEVKNDTVCLNLLCKLGNFFCLSLTNTVSRMWFHAV